MTGRGAGRSGDRRGRGAGKSERGARPEPWQGPGRAQRPHLHCACAHFDTKKCGEETGHRSHGTCCGCRGRADPGTQHLEITAPGARAPLPSLLTVARRMATERVRLRLKESKAPCFSILPDLPAPRSRRFYRRCGPARMPALCPALGGTVLGLRQTPSEHQPLRTPHPPPRPGRPAQRELPSSLVRPPG